MLCECCTDWIPPLNSYIFGKVDPPHPKIGLSEINLEAIVKISTRLKFKKLSIFKIKSLFILFETNNELKGKFRIIIFKKV